MDRRERSMVRYKVPGAKLLSALVVFLISGIAPAIAAPDFYSTSDPSHWQVATNVGGTDGAFSSFPTTGFAPAVALPARPGWIANNASGTNGPCPGCTYVFFVFRQTFDLTSFDATTADLKFQWAADDSGEGFAERGTWRPKFSVNGGSLVDGGWLTGNTYSYGPTIDVSSGFVAGLNHIDFYVEGNGVTDGMSLQTIGFTANPVPEPEAYAMMLAGLGLLGFLRRRRARDAA